MEILQVKKLYEICSRSHRCRGLAEAVLEQGSEFRKVSRKEILRVKKLLKIRSKSQSCLGFAGAHGNG